MRLEPDDLRAIVSDIRDQHRKRNYAMDQRKRANLALLAYLRMELGWNKSLPVAERAAISKRAMELVEIAEKIAKENEDRAKAFSKEAVAAEECTLALVKGGKVKKARKVKPRLPKEVKGAGDADFLEYQPLINATIQGRAHYDLIETVAEKKMVKLVSQIPFMCEFWMTVFKDGAVSAAVIIAEAANDDLSLISDFRSKSALWKRMGLGLCHNSDRGWIRQGGLTKNAPKEEWIAHGYNRKRRSSIWVIGKAIVFANNSVYRDVYDARKAREMEKAAEEGLTVIESGRIPAKRKHEFRSLGHVDRRAQRYMEKRLLRDVWKLWRANVVHAQHNQTPMLMAAE